MKTELEMNMLDRDKVLSIVRNVYAARLSGDKAALAQYWSEGAHFEIAGDGALLPEVTLTARTPMEAISKLIDRFAFSDLAELDTVVEGNTIAIRWRVTITAGANAPQPTQLFDLIKLDDHGKIASFIQFADNALIRHLAG